MFGAAAMSLSSICVVGNALRLRGFKSGFRRAAGTGADTAEIPAGGTLADASGTCAGGSGGDKAAKFTCPDRSGQAGDAAEPGSRASRPGTAGKTLPEEKEKITGTGAIPAERKKSMTKVMTIEGMMCAHCTGRVQKALEAVPGVSGVTMSLEEKTATVEMAGEVTDQELTGAVKEAGYEVTGIAVK